MNLHKQIEQNSAESAQTSSAPGEFELFVGNEETHLYRFLSHVVETTQQAEAILQEAFVEIAMNMDSSEPSIGLRAELFRAALRQARAKRNSETLAAPLRPERINFDTEAHASDRALDISIERLPFEYKVAFLLRDVVGFSKEELPFILELPLDDVAETCRRARVMVRRFFLRELSHRGSGFSSQTPDSSTQPKSELDRSRLS